MPVSLVSPVIRRLLFDVCYRLSPSLKDLTDAGGGTVKLKDTSTHTTFLTTPVLEIWDKLLMCMFTMKLPCTPSTPQHN